MPLEKYKNKRRFNKTPEPLAKVKKSSGKLIFVVQKHQASHLHYDLRLEMEGVLKSWAIPKGPTLNPEIKHLAAKVEDHPLDYASFEGVIPQGEYGAGQVIIWDKGTYEPATPGDNPETTLLAGLKKGDLKFILHGHKLKGEFVLVRFKNDPKNWLLIKKRDQFATIKNIQSQEESVKSGKTVTQMGKISAKSNSGNLRKLISKGQKGPMPKTVKPMLAKLSDEPFDDPDWIYEPKYDGYRALAQIENSGVRLYSRNNLDFTNKYPTIVEALAKIPHQMLIDGEVVALDKHGLPSFQLLQDYAKSPVDLVYFVFDLLYCDGFDLRTLPLLQRKEILKRVLPQSNHLVYSDHIEKEGLKLLALARKKGFEGVMAKRKNSGYVSTRSSDWQKFKNILVQEAVVCGFTQPRGGREIFGALVLGLFDNGKLQYIGHTGGGFDAAKLKQVMAKLKPLIVKKSPFAQIPKTNTPATWVKPELLVEVKFSEWTNEGLMRHPVFLELREDKKVEVTRKTN